jgi:hypothetical protein
MPLPEPRFRLPRVWSNGELKKIAKLFKGDIVNVSAWKDEDKEGGVYRNYFLNATSYTITNYKREARGFQGVDGEIFLDLTGNLPIELIKRFDVVFNHTTLEHIFDVDKAFSNLCLMSRDVVIVVLPFLQEMHGEYGDYWRFTPLAITKLFERNGLETIHLTFNKDRNASVYVFAVATRNASAWVGSHNFVIESGLAKTDKSGKVIGYNAITEEESSFIRRVINKLKSWR